MVVDSELAGRQLFGKEGKIKKVDLKSLQCHLELC